MLDLQPATDALSALVRGVRDDQLDVPTPSAGRTVADLLDHIGGFAIGFASAAAKTSLDAAPARVPRSANGSDLGADWRDRIPQQLDALAGAWREDAAWTGMTRAGGIDLTGTDAGLFALDEVVAHGWDLATATGQPFTCPSHLLEALFLFLSAFTRANPDGMPGLFGPPVSVPDSADLLDQVVGLTGRDPSLRSAAGSLGTS
jgi:uncharacterized protein (TIGR03086 family)